MSPTSTQSTSTSPSVDLLDNINTQTLNELLHADCSISQETAHTHSPTPTTPVGISSADTSYATPLRAVEDKEAASPETATPHISTTPGKTDPTSSLPDALNTPVADADAVSGAGGNQSFENIQNPSKLSPVKRKATT